MRFLISIHYEGITRNSRRQFCFVVFSILFVSITSSRTVFAQGPGGGGSESPPEITIEGPTAGQNVNKTVDPLKIDIRETIPFGAPTIGVKLFIKNGDDWDDVDSGWLVVNGAGTYEFDRPGEAWPEGDYKVEIWVSGAPQFDDDIEFHMVDVDL